MRMTNIKVVVYEATANARVSGTVTSGMVGIPVEFVLGSGWEGLTARGVARANGVAFPLIIVDGFAILPHELLVKPGYVLEIGVDGWDAEGNIRIPTVWARCGVIQPSVADADLSEREPDPTPSEIQQLITMAESTRGIALSVREDADSGKFDGAPGDDYILTDEDKIEIAEEAAEKVAGNTYTKSEIDKKIEDATPSDYDEVKQAVSQKLTEPSGAAVGQFFRVASVDADGHYVLEAVDAPTPDLTGYVKTTNYASSGTGGVIKTGSLYGFSITSEGLLSAMSFTSAQYPNKSTGTVISRGTLNNVLAAPSIQPSLSSTERAAAQQRIGIVTMTQEEYDLLDTPDPNTYYFIVDGDST